MQRSTFTFLSLFTISSFVLLAVAGCGSSSSDPSTPPQDVDDKAEVQLDETVADDDANTAGEAVFSYGDTTFTATLQFCSLQGGEDALFHGAARDSGGELVGYLSGDFGGLTDIPYGEVRIDLGATAQFENSDTFIAMGDAAAHIVVTDSSDTNVVIMGGVWDQSGTQLGTATLRVDC
ncbi:MAG: hypothetical protein ACTIJ6_00730 [Leucobacter sp.]